MEGTLQPHEAEYFSHFEALFNHPGWAQLVGELKEEADAIPLVAFDGAKSMEQLHSARAVYNTLYGIINKPLELNVRLRNVLAERAEESKKDEMPAEYDP